MGENITFDNASITQYNGNTIYVSGTLDVDYVTGAVSGTLTTSATSGGITTDTYNYTTNGTYSATGNPPTYSLQANDGGLGNLQASLTIAYSGQAPSSVTTTSTGPVLGITGTKTSVGVPVASVVDCFVEGTLIQTLKGDVPVEDLKVGDLAVTLSGAARPVVWIGQRTMRCRDHHRQVHMWPIRIAKDAFGSDRPTRDLYVSPGHSICVDMLGEVLIPAACLVNGSTIKQVEVDEVSYWHVELGSHDILLANGLPTESYLEMSNRGFFGEDNVTRLDDLPDVPVRTHADFCRPFHDSGPVVEAVRAQLRIRSNALGWTLTDAPFADLHLVVDGKRLDPVLSNLYARFFVPASARSVWLNSDAAVPDQTGHCADSRLLGVCVAGLMIDDGLEGRRVITADDPSLCVGFHECEEGVRRWTTGRALVPADLWNNCRGQFFLRVDLAVPALPRWVEPARETMAPVNDSLRLVRSA